MWFVRELRGRSVIVREPVEVKDIEEADRLYGQDCLIGPFTECPAVTDTWWPNGDETQSEE